MHNGVDPVSIPMEIIVSWCSIKTLYTTGNPSNVLLQRTGSGDQEVNYIWGLTYGMNYITEDPVRCPILRYSLVDTNNNILVHPYVTMTDGNNPSNTRITMKNTAPYTVTVRVIGFTEEKSAYVQWTVRVCGQETLSVVNSARKFYIFGIETGTGLPDSTRYHIIPQSTF